ncbi:fructose-6-phosphate aldolase, TalC/MipB family [Sphaerochaeta associata]|mgnify:FL=1|jgi:transaldolase|uniref:Fructose-6-phosphate aldolase n=1 Tax=Sphaerochaeta associata TaxID=1129264 RepID=A0ABY4DBT7_9SPIR|nr:fructose-6-phosphate aldolase [Sphaerochaeta associata]NLA98163.1 fructose-6-phosphate aldolase [Spirochaetales bacterium]UOM51736.1 fructose-6-phosphate aldolase [Sphaerochaeta associata]SMP52061.1 fructose-6-phosphate aldolase, TalC/MipB family [Sphaerochaeta associata]
MDLLLDTADLAEVEHALQYYPIKGVTTNPTMLSRLEQTHVLSHLKAIRALIGDERDLHVQLMARDRETMIREAHHLATQLGEQTFIAVPVTEVGLSVIKQLAQEGLNITASTVFSTIQGILAMLSGARYVAVFYDRMLNLDIDAGRVIKELAGLLWTNTSSTQVLAASFRNVAEVTNAYASGAGSCTVRPELLSTGLAMPSIKKAVQDFADDWKKVYGDKTLLEL